MMYPFKFRPVYKDYIWGGENLKNTIKIFQEMWLKAGSFLPS